ncbi:hypothetical protein DJFAAGMI_01407 [Comamonas sp. PE63]|uniref:Membrane-associated oxidoreductase n=1 Tax=Comamonas brasiliensis TaxID=1812482 RepID=A0ABS5LQ99_9BURK|nr:hypothetical protein [Comamonas sp. PE63]MBS3018675.1 hypothetical protein [Comamonas sp. PE63]
MKNLKPFGRSLRDFGELNTGEKKLLRACRMGKLAVLGDGVPQTPTDENSVRAGFVRFLLLGGDELAPVHDSGVQLQGAYVEGRLNLNGCSIPVGFDLLCCNFNEEISALDARLNGAFILAGSYIGNGIVADRMHSTGSLVLSDVTAKAAVSLSGAKIGGEVLCENGQFEVTQGGAFFAEGAKIENSVNLRNGFKATGEVRFLGASVGGNFDCSDGCFIGKTGVALAADGISINGDLFFCDGFKAKGAVRLLGAQIGGDLVCSDGEFDNKENNALSADKINVKGNVLLGANFKAKGKVRFLGAIIKGDFACVGGNLDVYEGTALLAYRINVFGNFFLRDGFMANGKVDLRGTQVNGDFVCSNAFISLENGIALSLNSAVVKGIFFLRNFENPIRLDMSHANVGVLDDDLNVWRDSSELDGFRYGAIGGQASTNGQDRIAWLLKQPERHIDTSEFRPQPWRQLQRVLREMGHTEDAKQVGIAFEDHLRTIGRMGLWPNDPCDLVRGFKGMVTRTAHYIFGKLAGYGYRPVNLVMWMLAVWLLCGGIYWALARSPFNAMAPSDPLVFQDARYSECRPTQDKQSDSVETHKIFAERTTGNWPFCSEMPGEYSTFSPFAYSLDLLLPVVDLGQEKFWGSYIPSPDETTAEESVLHWRWGYLVRFVAWFETLFGWVSSLLLVAIISGFSRRNDEE